jgi:hypothetical protein
MIIAKHGHQTGPFSNVAQPGTHVTPQRGPAFCSRTARFRLLRLGNGDEEERADGNEGCHHINGHDALQRQKVEQDRAQRRGDDTQSTLNGLIETDHP